MSASTSEVVAGGLQELGRVIVIGQTSAGKALPSMIRTLSNGDRLQYVVADLLKPSGGHFEREGVVPNIIVERQIEDYINQKDPEIQAAIQYLESKQGNKNKDMDTDLIMKKSKK